jgi:hypothetical protein
MNMRQLNSPSSRLKPPLLARTKHRSMPCEQRRIENRSRLRDGGDTAKAKAAYQDFLTLWKDADPDIPIYKQAKVLQ